MRKIYLETFGCQMNVLDSELVENQLTALGYEFTASLDEANVVLYNTCSVRERSEQKVWSRLGTLKARKAEDKGLVVGVIGCMAEREGAGLMKRMPQVDIMCGPGELDQLPQLLENAILTGDRQHALAGNTSRRSKTLQHAEEDGLEQLDLSRSFSAAEQKYQAYIRIVRGCNKFCTYCVVPYTRGPEVSRSPQAILEEAKKLVEAGCLEITLLGQTVNHYVHESETANVSTPTGPARKRTTFAELLKTIHDEVPALPRLRFVTSFPADFGDDILRVMAESPRICRYLHIPAQSGSNRILKLMNRGYTVESYLELLERARRIVPGIALAGDIIVGFPTETEEEYLMTRELLKQARYKNCFIFKYSPRPGTLAIKRHEDDVPEQVKRDRNNDLLKLQNQISNELNRGLIGETVEILCEGPSGWRGAETDSVVAGGAKKQGETCGSEHTHGNAVELGPLLKRAVVKQANGGSAAEQRLTEIAVNTDNIVQMTGRTQADQIVVFDGEPALEGRILKVRVKAAHGMTIFAETVGKACADNVGTLVGA